MTIVAQPVTGQDIAVAARATRKLLDVSLAEHGTSFESFATMNTIVALGASLDRDELVRNLSRAFDVDPSTVLTILHGLEVRGLVLQTPDSDGEVHVELTTEGRAEQQGVARRLAAVNAELYRDFDAEDLATARRVLVTLAERANAQFLSSIS